MAERYRVQVYWSPRAETPERLGQQLSVFLTALSSVHDTFSGWQFENPRTGAVAPADSPARCREALELAAVEWRAAGQKKTSYQPRLFLGDGRAPEVELRVTCGIDPLPFGPIFTPNRLELLVRASPGGARATRPTLETALRAAVAVFRPEFGHAGTESMPQPAEPIFSDGTPVVGWMTYLSTAYPPLPAALPKPAESAKVANLGTLVVACPDLFDPRNDKHLAALTAVHEALSQSGVLVPAPALSRPPGGA